MRVFLKYIIVVLLVSLCVNNSNAQFGSAPPLKSTPQNPVSWQFSIKKMDNGAYRLEAKATLANGFHIWAQDPGGDGSLIPTSFTSEQMQSGKWINDWKEMESPKSEKVSVFGDAVVRWFEKTVTFYRDFNAKKGDKIKGAVQYQSCNDQMCFPPAIQNFMVVVD
ncbi:hypothetical protein F0919_09050 [Taibaiella lutea]|uniref:Thiol:disulfide interchange protein DsbD N-terminal domain-containing protein n=1 Tax=Taibaiella lutea TaxID=2608001 RepID=A0A5M6CNM5_9BACT|nr:protein-disulfide reductase DsbD domain-containing protein [Taibaiella lutea]KAA5534749.1 hypothetical protein F0919_09050 [Taibaiella lutea]